MATTEPTPEAPEAASAESPRGAVAPLSPVGLSVRRALILATVMVPVVWAVWGVLYYRGRSGTPTGSWELHFLWCYYLGPLYLPLVVIGWLAFLVFFKLRARLIEMIFVLAMISLLPGSLISLMQWPEDEQAWMGVLLVCSFLMILSACWIGAGSVWGLSVSQRTHEQRTWVRLGYIVLGWGMVPGFACVGFFGLALWSLVGGGRFCGNALTAWILLGVSTCFMLVAAFGLRIERDCRKKHGPVKL